MKVIGLTGGIGTGKSTASAYLQKQGFPIIDADRISREVVEPGRPLLEKLRDTFGEAVILPDGNLDRKALGAMVFAEKEKRCKLDQLMHGEILQVIRSRIKEAAASNTAQALFLDVPLLFEVGLDRDCETVWLVTADPEIRLQRVMLRDGLTVEEVQARIDGQMPEEEKRRRADVLIDNSGTQEELYEQLERQIKTL